MIAQTFCHSYTNCLIFAGRSILFLVMIVTDIRKPNHKSPDPRSIPRPNLAMGASDWATDEKLAVDPWLCCRVWLRILTEDLAAQFSLIRLGRRTLIKETVSSD